MTPTMNEISNLLVYSVAHIPRSVRPLLLEVLSKELSFCCTYGIWGFVHLFTFAKAVLCSPPRGRNKGNFVVKSLLSCFKQWQARQLVSLLEEARSEARHSNHIGVDPCALQSNNA